MTVNKITNAPTNNEVINKINEVIDNLGGASITIDDTLSTTSTNPVQNKVITTELNKKIESINSNDVIIALGYTPYNSTNPAGYTSNIGTVTSVNNNQPDANGNVTIQTGGTVDQTYDPTSANAQSGIAVAEAISTKQNTLFSGTNIKTINNNSILGSGNLTVTASITSSDVTNALGYTPENRSNKVTSISSSSTNTQYPSAKLLYDQLALKQNTSTAVTHTANTAVGSSTKPIYISSTGVATASTSTIGSSTTPVYMNNGTITSTGLSIANTRFDGQWIIPSSNYVISTNASGSRTVDLSSFLPSNSANTKYLVLVQVNVSSNSGCYFALGTAESPYTNASTCANIQTYVSNNVTAAINTGILPVTNKTLYAQQSAKASTGANLRFMAYKRIGTNDD